MEIVLPCNYDHPPLREHSRISIPSNYRVATVNYDEFNYRRSIRRPMDGFQEVKSRRTKKTEVALANTPAPGSRYPRYINGYQVYGEGSSITSLIKRKFGRDNFDFEPVREVGDGTEDSPLITWFYQAGTNLRYEEAWCEQTEEILTTVARQLGQTHVILRREAHNQRNTYDAMGSIITHTIRTRNGDIDVNTLEFDDWHLTATFGRDDETLYLQGHVYVVWHGQPNRIGSSISLMEQPQFQRHHAKPGEEGTLVLWLCDNTKQKPPSTRRR